MNFTDDEKTWLNEVIKASGDAINESGIVASIIADYALFEKDPIAVVQIGLAVLQDKPIYLLVAQGSKISPTLSRLATKIISFDILDPDSIRKATELLFYDHDKI